MPSRKVLGLIGFVLVAAGLLSAARAPATGAEPGTGCPAGPSQIQAMVQSDPAFEQDENSGIWARAGDCGWQPVSDGAGGRAISQFQDVARDNGLGGALRTFARNDDFRLYIDAMSAMGLGPANSYLDKQPFAGTWREISRGGSADATLLYAVGELSLPKGHVYQYAQVWQFDPKVANWGVRLLLLRPLAGK
jgi:hypothetical protein